MGWAPSSPQKSCYSSQHRIPQVEASAPGFQVADFCTSLGAVLHLGSARVERPGSAGLPVRQEELLAPAVNASPQPEHGGLLLGQCQQRKAAVVLLGLRGCKNQGR